MATRLRPAVTAASVPRLPRHVRLRDDRARGCWVLLAPERVLLPDETALAVLHLVDGNRSVRQIAEAPCAGLRRRCRADPWRLPRPVAGSGRQGFPDPRG